MPISDKSNRQLLCLCAGTDCPRTADGQDHGYEEVEEGRNVAKGPGKEGVGLVQIQLQLGKAAHSSTCGQGCYWMSEKVQGGEPVTSLLDLHLIGIGCMVRMSLSCRGS
jgi:hypothetical protein